MKTFLTATSALLLCASTRVAAQADYLNFIRQVQVPSGVQWDMTVAAASEGDGTAAPLPIDTAGARFELWTVNSTTLAAYLLGTQFVGTFVPTASVTIQSEDPYALVPRTRADRPFTVTVSVSDLLSGPDVPAAAKSVDLFRHVQGYGPGGVGQNLDRNQAQLLSRASISQNGMQTLSYAVTSVPGEDRAKIRGEENFAVYSLADEQGPAAELASKRIQIWPVADGSISGITPGAKLNFRSPPLTFTLNDLYPTSRTYAQAYPGEARLGVSGKVIPGSSLVISDEIPQDRVILVKDYGEVFDADGLWTVELLTETPFGIDRLAHVTFEVNLTIRVTGTVTSME